MKRGLRPLLTIVIVYALATALQMGAGYAPGDGLLVLAKLLAALLAAALVEMYNRAPLAVKDVQAGHGQHGDAHFMEPEEVKRVYHEVQQGNETQPAMLVGASKSTWLVDTSDQSVLMVAPPGAGKSTSLYIPTITYNARVNLRTHDAQGIGQGASMVLVSVKDDLYTITSAELKKCGYRVLKLDLRNVFCSCHFNLLYRVNIEIDAWRKEQDAKQRAVHYATAERYAKVIASAIIGNTGSVNSGDSSEYFNETARGLITGLVLLVSQYGQDGERHIVSVFNLIVELAGADNPEKGNTVQKSRLAAMLEGVTDRRIKGYISTTTSADIRTTLNIVSSALSKLLKFVDAELEQLICTHDNDLDAERFIERPTAIFLIAPDENETRHFLASLFVRFLTDDLIALAERQGGHCPRPFYYFLDEFGNFPAIPGVTSLFSAIRSRGGRILVAVQSYSQFLLKYDKNVTEIIKDNCQILLNTFVSPSAQDTATSISKMLGDETILTGSSSRSDGKTTSSHHQAAQVRSPCLAGNAPVPRSRYDRQRNSPLLGAGGQKTARGSRRIPGGKGNRRRPMMQPGLALQNALCLLGTGSLRISCIC